MEKRYKYPLIVFLLWIVSPLLLLSISSLYNSIILDPKSSLTNLMAPAILFSIFAYGITKIKKQDVRVGLYYALIGAVIWSSPAIYFLPSSSVYSNLSQLGKFLTIIIPTTLLSLIFFAIGKTKSSPEKDLTDLYIKNNAFNP